jgi:hypothetical protein
MMWGSVSVDPPCPAYTLMSEVEHYVAKAVALGFEFNRGPNLVHMEAMPTRELFKAGFPVV